MSNFILPLGLNWGTVRESKALAPFWKLRVEGGIQFLQFDNHCRGCVITNVQNDERYHVGLYLNHGGGGGIRTPETLSGLTVFKTAGFNRSPTPPLPIIPTNTAPQRAPAFTNVHDFREGNQRRVVPPICDKRPRLFTHSTL